MSTGDIITLVALIAVAASILVWSWYFKERRRDRLPKTWQHIGTCPQNADVALDVIKSCLSHQPERWGGIIEWVDEPFMAGNILAAGAVFDFEVPRLRVLRYPQIYNTALAHEIGHAYEKLKDGDPKLYEWVASTNAKIKERIAGMV